MLLASIANGALRDLVYGKFMHELTAHQLSTVISLALLGVVMWRFLRYRCPQSTSSALLIGALWLLLTVTFEFVFFHYVGGHSWSALLANYNIARGRIWVLVLLWIAVAPWVLYRLQTNTG